MGEIGGGVWLLALDIFDHLQIKTGDGMKTFRGAQNAQFMHAKISENLRPGSVGAQVAAFGAVGDGIIGLMQL